MNPPVAVLPTISLVTPTLNQAGTLPATLESAARQDHAPHEHIVIDALSTDATAEILARYRSTPFARIVRESDSGQSDAIDKGIRLASGEIVGWLNSDDVLLPGALRAVATAFAQNPGTPLVYGGGFKIDFSGRTTKHVRPLPFDPGLLRRAFYFLQPAMFFRRDAYLRVGGLDRDLAYAMDWDLVLKLARLGDFVAVDANLASLRCYEATKSQTGGWQRAREIALIGRRHHGFADPNHLVYLAKSRLAKFSSTAFRRHIDGLISSIFDAPGTMIEGWPPSVATRS